MSIHDTRQVEAPTISMETHSPIITQTRDLVLQACGFDSLSTSDHGSHIQPDESLPRRRGRPQQVSWTQLWSSLLLCALQGMHSFEDWRRLLGLHQIGPFAPVWLTRNGLVKRLLQAGPGPLQDLWEALNAHLACIGSQAVPAPLATFASGIFCLDETRLDAVGRYLKPLRGLSTHDPACFAGKLIGLLDVRAQRWLRLEWRQAVHENCKVDILDFLHGLAQGNLVLFDLGYFSGLFLRHLDTAEALVGQSLSGEDMLSDRACVLSPA